MSIEHVFVLMMENRSFDHLLGFSKIQGTDPSGNPTTIDGLTGNESNISPRGETVTVSSPADFLSDHGPGHEFKDVKEQLCGKAGTYSSTRPQPGEYDPSINNSGYISNFALYERRNPEAIMKCFSPSQLPVITSLAKEFAVCDRWFSSMPGPTWPNRFFVHAASSGGLDDSPSFSREFKSIVSEGFKFDNGTIYDRLDDGKYGWMIYSDDEFPQVLSIAGMRANSDKHFRPYKLFKQDLSDPGFSQSYVFIEPDYHAFTGKFRGGNSQHPMDDVTSGERFVKDVYESIRSSPLWEKSLLIITYDEHGGFYDHVVPPGTVSPGDSDIPGNSHNNFDFRQLGVRVPTVIVSPLVAKGTIDHTTYDHTSVLATLETLFKLGSLTKRDETAQTLNHLFKLQAPRTDAPLKLSEPAISGYVHKEGEEEKGVQGLIIKLIAFFGGKKVDPSVSGFHHVALLRDLQNSPETEKEKITQRFLGHKQFQAVRYMRRIKEKAAATHKPATERNPRS
ncbi:MAG: alkaline phosphatase family protein [Thaumarchaeota archaeon]|nr:alkaline phosphatase family protein [Nitrososphaerota archaeon]